MLPFTLEQFIGVFKTYNEAIWPAQLFAYLVGAIAASFLVFRRNSSDRAISAILSAMWFWTGIAYHLLFFSPTNKAAYLFALLFLAQGLLLLVYGIYLRKLRFAFDKGPAAWLGVIFILYAAIVYPVVGTASGHPYPELPMFGVTPCPVTIFTFGLLLIASPDCPRPLLVIPFLWSLIGGSAAFLLGIVQDWPLLFSGLIAIPLIEYRKNCTDHPPAHQATESQSQMTAA